MKSTKNKGFTLIELLVVIAVIGLIAGMVLVSTGGSRSKARDARRMQDMHQLAAAQAMYYGINEQYVASDTMPVSIGTYMAAAPKDPVNSGSTTYTALNNTATDTSPYALKAGQWFCYYVYLENPNKTAGGCTSTACSIFTASQSGNYFKTGPPTNAQNCATQG